MDWWVIALLIYAAGAIGTLIFNLALIVGPVNYPLSVARNVLLWPVCLPILIYIAVSP